MKQNTALALAALFALSAAMPLEKRDMLTVIDIVSVVETVDITTTIFVPPGDPRLVAQQAAINHQAPAQALAKTTSTAPIYSPFTTNSLKPSQTSVAEPQAQQKDAVAQAASTSSSAAAPVVAPVKPAVTPIAAPAPAANKMALPVQQQAAPVASHTTDSTTTSNSDSNGGVCGDVGAICVASDVTTFTDSVGACGKDDLSTYGDNFFALAYEMMGPRSSIGTSPDNPYCGRRAEITHNGVTVTGRLADKCMGCSGASLDLSPALFASLFNGAKTGRFHDISYKFIDPLGAT